VGVRARSVNNYRQQCMAAMSQSDGSILFGKILPDVRLGLIGPRVQRAFTRAGHNLHHDEVKAAS
jgi:hypothetical protein